MLTHLNFKMCRLFKSYRSLILIISCVLFLFAFILSIQSPIIYVRFEDIDSLLESKWQSDSDGMKPCHHKLMKHPSENRLELVLNVTPGNLDALTQHVAHGGSWSPPHCRSKYHVNIIIPFRNRHWQLPTFLYHYHRFLMLQEIEYHIIIVEQSEKKQFNRGKLFNIGFVEMERRYASDCYIFHDVDLMAANLNNAYACTKLPRHMSSALDIFNFRVPYATNFGGVVALTRQQFQLANGYSNSFYGWGAEDDDFYFRVRRHMPIIRLEDAIAQYITLDHTHEEPNLLRETLLRQGPSQYATNGLNSLNYTLLDFELKSLYTWMLVDL